MPACRRRYLGDEDKCQDSLVEEQRRKAAALESEYTAQLCRLSDTDSKYWARNATPHAMIRDWRDTHSSGGHLSPQSEAVWRLDYEVYLGTHPRSDEEAARETLRAREAELRDQTRWWDVASAAQAVARAREFPGLAGGLLAREKGLRGKFRHLWVPRLKNPTARRTATPLLTPTPPHCNAHC